MIKRDLEALTGIMVQGSATTILYHLLKDSKHNKHLLEEYAYLLIDKDLQNKIMRGAELLDASTSERSAHTNKESNSRPSFEEWLSKRTISSTGTGRVQREGE